MTSSLLQSLNWGRIKYELHHLSAAALLSAILVVAYHYSRFSAEAKVRGEEPESLKASLFELLSVIQSADVVVPTVALIPVVWLALEWYYRGMPLGPIEWVIERLAAREGWGKIAVGAVAVQTVLMCFALLYVAGEYLYGKEAMEAGIKSAVAGLPNWATLVASTSLLLLVLIPMVVGGLALWLDMRHVEQNADGRFSRYYCAAPIVGPQFFPFNIYFIYKYWAKRELAVTVGEIPEDNGGVL